MTSLDSVLERGLSIKKAESNYSKLDSYFNKNSRAQQMCSTERNPELGIGRGQRLVIIQVCVGTLDGGVQWWRVW